MTYLAEIFLVLGNIVMAWWHSKLIAKGITPKHGLWGLSYLAVAGLLAFLTHSWLLLVASLLIRKVVFDVSLNLFRGLPTFYVSSSSTSIIDDIHNGLFGKRSEVYLTLYAVGIVVINFFL